MKSQHLISAVVWFSLICAAQAQEAGEHINKTGSYTEDLYLAGENVRIAGDIEGDVVASGGHVIIEQYVNGDVIVAGGRIKMDADVSDDVRLAGGDVQVNGQIGDDFLAAGGAIMLSSNGLVNGRAWIGGGRVEIDGRIKKELKAAAGEVIIRGRIEGNAVIKAETLRILPGAVILGDLDYSGPVPAQIDPAAQIQGTVRYQASDNWDGEQVLKWIGVGLLFGALFCIGLLIAICLLYFIFPNTFSSISALMQTQFLRSLGLGALVFFLLPVVAGFFVVTVIGIPIALLLIFFYMLLLLVSSFAVVYFVSDKLLRWIKRYDAGSVGWRVAAIVVAFIVVLTIKLIPFIGTPLVFLAMLVALGALLAKLLGVRAQYFPR